MAYKLSQRANHTPWGKDANEPNRIDIGKLATVLMIFGLLSFVIAWFFSWTVGDPYEDSFYLRDAENTHIIGPISINKKQQVWNINLKADVPVGSWSFIEGAILDRQQQHLFAFGKELWHETGRDSDGPWRESDVEYSMKVTFPDIDTYYLKFTADEGSQSGRITVNLSARYGSSIPNIIFGIVCIILGIILNEINNNTIGRGIKRAIDEA